MAAELDSASARRRRKAVRREHGLAALSASGSGPKRAFKAAVALHGLGRSQEALAALDRLLARHPDHAEALAARIDIVAESGDPEEAVGLAEQALARLPGDRRLGASRCRALLRAGRAAECRAALLSLAQTAGAEAAELVAPVMTLAFERGDFGLADALAIEVLRHDPQNRRAARMRVKLAARAGELQRLLDAPAAEPTGGRADALPPRQRIEVLGRAGRVVEQLACLDGLLAERPQDIDLLCRRLQATIQTDDMAECNRLVDEILAVSSASPEEVLRQVDTAIEFLRLADGLRIAKEAVAAFPDRLDLEVAQLRVFHALRDRRAVTALSDALLARSPGNPDVLLVVAEERVSCGEMEAAVEILEDILSRAPDDRRARRRLSRLAGWKYPPRGSRRREIGDEAAPKPAHDWAAVIERAVTARKQGQAEQAAALLEQALAPHRGAVALGLVQTLIDNSFPQEAFALLRGWIEGSNYDHVLIRKLSPALRALGGEAQAYLGEVWRSKAVGKAAPGFFAKAVEETLDGSRRWLVPLDQAMLHAAWRFADQAAFAFPPWAERAQRGATLQALLERAFTDDASGLEFLAQRITTPDLGPLHALTAQGRPFLLVGTHFGPVATLWHLPRLFPKLRYLTANVARSSGDRLPFRALSYDGRSFHEHRTLLTALANGEPIMAAGDAPPRLLGAARRARPVPARLLGRTLDFPSLLPRLAYRHGLRSFWIQDHHRDGRITIDLAEMPEPDRQVSEGEWCHRWTAVYARRLEAVMSGPPDDVCRRPPSRWQDFMCLPSREEPGGMARAEARPATRAPSPAQGSRP